MFKRLGNVFGARQKADKKRNGPEKPSRSSAASPGEGIRQLAAALPHSDPPASPARPQPVPAAKAAPPPQPAPQAPAPAKAAAAAPPADPPVDRTALIREALRIRRDKARALDDLPTHDREQLRHLAEKMMGVTPEPPAADPDAPPGSGRGRSRTRH